MKKDQDYLAGKVEEEEEEAHRRVGTSLHSIALEKSHAFPVGVL